MKRKFSLLMAVLIAATLQYGCEKEPDRMQEVQIEETAASPSNEVMESSGGSNTSSEKVEKEEPSFAGKWVSATRFIQETLVATPGANEKISKEETDAAFDSLVQDIENGLDDEAVVYYRLRSILASMQHVHMALYYPEKEQCPVGELVQLDFMWTQEGLILCGADKAYKEELGSVVTKVNGYSLKEIMDKYATICCEETEAGKKHHLYDLCTADLKYLGIMKENDDSIVLSLKNDKGEEKEMVYTFNSNEDCEKCSLVSEEDMPFTFKIRSQNNLQNYSYLEKPEDGAMYFQYLLCVNQEGVPFYKFFQEMLAKMKAQDETYDTLVIDVRWNPGGDRAIFQEQLMKNKDYLKGKHICIITGDMTASAANLLIEDCLTFLDDVTIYGGPTRGAIHNYTAVKQISVPGTELMLQVPTLLDTTYAVVKKYGDVVESVTPDVPVEISIDDLKKGTDTIYAKIVEDKKHKEEEQ